VEPLISTKGEMFGGPFRPEAEQEKKKTLRRKKEFRVGRGTGAFFGWNSWALSLTWKRTTVLVAGSKSWGERARVRRQGPEKEKTQAEIWSTGGKQKGGKTEKTEERFAQRRESSQGEKKIQL